MARRASSRGARLRTRKSKFAKSRIELGERRQRPKQSKEGEDGAAHCHHHVQENLWPLVAATTERAPLVPKPNGDVNDDNPANVGAVGAASG